MSSIKHFQTINSPKEFNRIYSKPTHCWHSEWFVLFYKDSPSYQVAFVASKKVGKAVLRNRAKRVLRAHFIEFSDKLKSGQYIFVAKPPIINSNYQKVNKTFLKIYKRLKLLKNSEN